MYKGTTEDMERANQVKRQTVSRQITMAENYEEVKFQDDTHEYVIESYVHPCSLKLSKYMQPTDKPNHFKLFAGVSLQAMVKDLNVTRFLLRTTK